MNVDRNLIKHWAMLFESGENCRDCMLGERTNPDGTIDNVSFQGDGESVFVDEVLAFMFRGLGYLDLIGSNGMIEISELAFRCGMGRLATMKCQIKAVDMSFDRVLDGHEIQKILKEKIEHNLEIHGEDSEYVVSEGFDKEFKDAFKRVVHDKLVLTRAGIGPKKLPARFEFGFEDNEPDDGYDYTRTRDVRWTVGIEFYEISNEEARKRGLTLVEFHNFKNKKEIDKILSRQFRKNLHKPDLPQESIGEQISETSGDQVEEAFKKGVHDCAEKIHEGIKQMLQFYTVPSFGSQSEEFRTSFENVMSVIDYVRALLKLTST